MWSCRETVCYQGGVALIVNKAKSNTILRWKPVNDRILYALFDSKFAKLSVIVAYAPTEERILSQTSITDTTPTCHQLVSPFTGSFGPNLYYLLEVGPVVLANHHSQQEAHSAACAMFCMACFLVCPTMPSLLSVLHMLCAGKPLLPTSTGKTQHFNSLDTHFWCSSSYGGPLPLSPPWYS